MRYSLALSLMMFTFAAPAFAMTLTDASQCTGGTLVAAFSDLQDGGGFAIFNGAQAVAQAECGAQTPPGGCCSVHVRTNAASVTPSQSYTIFDYTIYAGGTLASGFPPYSATDRPSGTLPGEQGKYLAGLSSAAITASIVANPQQVLVGSSTLLTWNSNATNCTGTNFSTGNAPRGSALVAPQVDTTYSVTCTSPGGVASSKTTVVVIVPSPSLSVSCSAYPSRASIGESVLWVAAVSGPQGTYSYQWTGTDGLSGTDRQTLTQYRTEGLKSASLTVSVVPSAQVSLLDRVLQVAAMIGGARYASAVEPGQCPAGQTAVPKIDVGGQSCSGGTQVGRIAEMEDAVQLGLQPPNYFVDKCIEAGARNGDCCQWVQESGNPLGAGYPPNSFWSITVFRGGSPSPTEPKYSVGRKCLREYSCSSVAGIVGTQCIGGGVTTGLSRTVSCDTQVRIAPAQCADGVDNDSDGLVDRLDPGCTSETDMSEGSAATALAQCADGVDNNGDGLADWPDDPFCESLADTLEAAPPAELVLTINPPLIKKNEQCSITFAARAVRSCSLQGTGLTRTIPAVNGNIATSVVVTPGLAQTARYTLSCTALDGRVVSKAVDCRIAPSFEEI